MNEKRPEPVAARVHPDLPVFRLEWEDRAVFYVPPGELALVDLATAAAIETAWRQGRPPREDPLAAEVEGRLRARAGEALDRRRRLSERPYQPECLTVVLTDACRFACEYCYSRMSRSAGPGAGPTEAQVAAAAALAAENSRERGGPFRLVVHGGGEPTLDFHLLEKVVRLTRALAGRRGLDWTGYIATNGFLSTSRAAGLARMFDRVGLSCDGPPDIQDRQRPLASGRPASRVLERTAQILAESGIELSARATITPRSFRRQVEIVEYLCSGLKIRDIRFEPVFGAGKAGFEPDLAEEYAANFLAARRQAARLGGNLSQAGVRPEEIHGPFCEVSRNVLRLVPGGWASACFLFPGVHGLTAAELKIGAPDPISGRFLIDANAVAALGRAADRIPSACRDCLNIFHCSRGCPDRCPVSPRPGPDPGGDFRCRLNQALARAMILEAAARLPEAGETLAMTISGRPSPEERVAALPAEAPATLDVGEIRRTVQAISAWRDPSRARQPSPPWERTSWSHSGPEAWAALQGVIHEDGRAGPMSVYAHIPFCEERCGFCDCRAVPLARPGGRLETGFLETLVSEIKAWGKLGPLRKRPVATVHFGGGTPNRIGDEGFNQIIEALRANLNITPATEWAVEITGRLMTPERLERLRRWGFSRLHVGVQSLDDSVRARLGRRDAGAELLGKIKTALGLDFVASGDLICGLPGQTPATWLDTVQRLVEAGISGLSLYRFNISRRNLAFVRRNQPWTPDPVRAYVLFLAGVQVLFRAGYRFRYYNHLARPEDLNLYFTHPARGEDLLALGPTADGVFGDFAYRAVGLGAYRRAARDPRNPAGLEGGGRLPAWERVGRPVLTGLISGRLSAEALGGLGLERLADRWLSLGLLRPGARDESLELTANGAWFIDDLLGEVEEALTGAAAPTG
ncbi:MAG: radical SAM protein [Pseudomonadota bacterium]